MATRYIPDREADMRQWAENFDALLTANPALYGLQAGDAQTARAAPRVVIRAGDILPRHGGHRRAGKRKVQRERRPPTLPFALCPNGPAVQVHDVAGEHEAEAGAILDRRHMSAIRPITIEHVRQEIGGDAVAAVGDAEHRAISRPA